MILDDARAHFEEGKASTLEWLAGELAGLRSGRVKPELIASIPVEHYGTRTPLQGLASVSSSDARTLTVSPWDPTAVAAIERALTQANLGVQPIIDGKIIRLSFPSLTEEVRQQTIKQIHAKAEEARIRLRRARDEALAMLKVAKQSSDITEDDFYDGREELDKLIDTANEDVNSRVGRKEEEVKTV